MLYLFMPAHVKSGMRQVHAGEGGRGDPCTCQPPAPSREGESYVRHRAIMKIASDRDSIADSPSFLLFS